MTKSIKIEYTTPDMAEMFVRIQHNAVHHGQAWQFYSKEILDDWAPPITKERINEFKRKMIERHSVGLIAYADCEPLGFGIIDLYQKRIGAIYVKLESSGLHIGGRLFHELETIARQNGITQLKLDSSLNAKTFYLSNGYIEIAEDFFSLPNGRRMACVKMSKILRP